MNKPELRKVYYTKWQHPSEDYKGYFHQFGNRYSEQVEAVVVVAIIENISTGNVEIIEPNCIRFVDKWDDQSGFGKL